MDDGFEYFEHLHPVAEQREIAKLLAVALRAPAEDLLRVLRARERILATQAMKDFVENTIRLAISKGMTAPSVSMWTWSKTEPVTIHFEFGNPIPKTGTPL